MKHRVSIYTIIADARQGDHKKLVARFRDARVTPSMEERNLLADLVEKKIKKRQGHQPSWRRKYECADVARYVAWLEIDRRHKVAVADVAKELKKSIRSVYADIRLAKESQGGKIGAVQQSYVLMRRLMKPNKI